MIRRHPIDGLLHRWLDADDDANGDVAKVSAHLESCARCAGRIEQLVELDSPPGGPVGDALVTLLSPPAGLTARVERRVVDRLGARQMAAVVGDLLGAAIETSKLLLTEEDHER